MKALSRHKAVLTKEVIEYLKPEAGQVIVDCTVNGGHHAKEILKMLRPNGMLVGIDADQDALKRARTALEEFKGSFTLKHSNFSEIDIVLSQLNIDKADAILADLGFSQDQMDDAARGFSFQHDGPLDMRMDRRLEVIAEDLVNDLSNEELARIIKKYGEERYARRIARAVVKARERERIRSTSRLVEVIEEAVPGSHKKYRIHPATRTFQALRIVVNSELKNLETLIEKLSGCIKKGGRAAFISFHSLEDRIIKHGFLELKKQGNVKIITKKPVRATDEEIRGNRRARSSKLRVVERL